MSFHSKFDLVVTHSTGTVQYIHWTRRFVLKRSDDIMSVY